MECNLLQFGKECFIDLRPQEQLLQNELNWAWFLSKQEKNTLFQIRQQHITKWNNIPILIWYRRSITRLQSIEKHGTHSIQILDSKTLAHYENKFTKTFRPTNILHIFTKFQFGVFHHDFFFASKQLNISKFSNM